MHTFFVPRSQSNEDIATIVGSEHHHLRNVVRLDNGEIIRIIDGEGVVITATITKIETDLTIAKIETQEIHDKSTPSITLLQGIPKSDKMELILQKTTELGVNQIIPIITERSLQQPSKNRIDRWQRIILSATKQSGQAWLPKLSDIQILQDCIHTTQTYDLTLIFWEKESDQHIKLVLRDHPEVKSVAIIIGPEGGFTDNEAYTSIEMGCIPVKLCSNILRTETAAIAGVSMVAYEYKI